MASLVVGSACGDASADGDDLFAEDAVTVRPRVAIDGLIELSARTEGRLFVDEVVFHAPSVQIRNGPFAIADLLATDPEDAGPLFFRYALADGGGAGAVASERRWSLTPDGISPESEVSFEFSPFSASAAALDDVLARTGWDLSALDGYTAYVHGYVSMESEDLNIRRASRFGGGDERKSGDSEGDPAHDGEEAAGDAEGDPAHGGEEAAGDAEGDPAHGGEEAAGDSEGDPAEGTGESSNEKQAASGRDPESSHIRRPGGNASGGELVPFFLVFDSSLELGVPLMELGLTELAPDEFLPIDLRVDVNRLLNDNRLEDLDSEAAEVLKRSDDGFAVIEMGAREASRAFALDLDTVQKRTKAKDADQHTIELSGDPRE